MNPESAPQQNIEYHPSVPMGAEQPNPNHEGVGERPHEYEQNVQQVDRQTAPPPLPVMSAPVPMPVPLPQVQQQSDDSVGPTVANDDDLIEKEWVDKAKKIIADTQDDPYRREQEVNKLQIDYLRKRYGKELGAPN
jgi:hypothetical protein